jgi:hypothetical protein
MSRGATAQSLAFFRHRRHEGKLGGGNGLLSASSSSSTAAASLSTDSSYAAKSERVAARDHLLSLSEELRGLGSFDFEEEPCCHAAIECRRFQDLVLGILLGASQDEFASNPAAAAAPPPPPSWHKTGRLLAAKAGVVSAMNHDYTEVLLDQFHRGDAEPSYSSSSSISSPDLRMHLVAASHLLQEFVNIVDASSPPPPPSSSSSSVSGHGKIFLLESVLETILAELMKFLRPRIAHHYCQDASTPTTATSMSRSSRSSILRPDFTPRDAAHAITWIDSWLKIFQGLPPFADAAVTISSPHTGWMVEDRDRLLDLYLDKAVVREIRVLRDKLQLRSVLDAEDDVLRKNACDETLATTVPEQISFMVDSQLAVALECLVAEEHVGRVLAACNNELSLLVGDWMLAIGSEWKSIPAHWFCALVNDCSRLAELCEERKNRYLSAANDDDANGSSSSRDAADVVVREFLELGSHAVRFLCEHIVYGLCEPDQPILSSVGTREWESDGTQSALERTIATFDDYLQDLKSWLSGSYWLPKVLKHLFDLTLQVYVESFFSNTMACGVKDPIRAAKELNEDYLRLVIFFNSDRFERFHDVGGYYTQQTINSKLHIIRCLSTLVDPSVEPDDAFGEARFLLSELLGDASSVLHLAGLRKRHNPLERVEWLRVVSKAKRCALVRRGGGSSVVAERTISYRLPDLRNSPYLSKVRPNARDVRRRLSTESLALAQSTSRILKISLGG